MPLDPEESFRRDCLARWLLNMPAAERKQHWDNMQLRYSREFMADLKRRYLEQREKAQATE